MGKTNKDPIPLPLDEETLKFVYEYTGAYSIDPTVISDSIAELDLDLCKHEFVNVSFMGRKMVCKHCDLEELES